MPPQPPMQPDHPQYDLSQLQNPYGALNQAQVSLPQAANLIDTHTLLQSPVLQWQQAMDLFGRLGGHQLSNQNPQQYAPVDSSTLSGTAQQIAQAGSAMFGPKEVQPLLNIVKAESGFNPQAANPSSTARGLFQFLNSTSRNYGLGADAAKAPAQAQIAAGLQYIKDRYGTPSQAWQFHLQKGYY